MLITGGKSTILTAKEIDLLPILDANTGINDALTNDEPLDNLDTTKKAYIDLQYDTDIIPKHDECNGLDPKTSVDAAYVKEFCQNRAKYQADLLEQKYANEKEGQQADMGEKEFSIISISPNPATTHAKISYDLEATGEVSLVVKNIQGQTLISVLSNVYQEKGHQVVDIETKDLVNGIYFCTLSHNGRSETQKLIIVK